MNDKIYGNIVIDHNSPEKGLNLNGGATIPPSATSIHEAIYADKGIAMIAMNIVKTFSTIFNLLFQEIDFEKKLSSSM